MLTLRPLEEGTISRRGISIEVASQRASVTLEGVSKDTSRRKGKLSVSWQGHHWNPSALRS